MQRVLGFLLLSALAAAQTQLTNDDLVKLVKAGMSEDFVLGLIQQQPAKLSADASRLIDLKNSGVHDRIITAVAQKGVAQEPLNTDSLLRLGKAGFSDTFILDLVDRQPGRFATDAARLTELKEAGVSERVVAALIRKSPPQEPLTVDGVTRLTKAGFSEEFVLDQIKQRGKFNVDAMQLIDLKKAGVSERILAVMAGRSGGGEIARGTEITIRMIDSIDSERAKEGDQFHASLEDPITVGGEVIVPKGADAVVRLVAEKESGKFTGKTELTVELVSLTIKGKPVAMNTTSVSQASKSRGSRTAKQAAAVGAVGAIIGAIAGGGKGAAIGAGAGAAAGAGAQIFMKGQRVLIPTETELTFTTQAAVQY